MNRNVGILIVLVIIGLWLLSSRTSPPTISKPTGKTTIHAESKPGVREEIRENLPEVSAQTVRKETLPAPAELARSNEELAPSSEGLVSIQIVRQLAWESMPTTPKLMDEFFSLKHLSANHPPPAENQAKYFRGLRILNDRKLKYIDMRYENDKWIISDGETPDQMILWPPRDVIPYKDQADVWSLYYGDGVRLLLRHFSKIHIPELDGNFEVLSGWIFNREIIYGGVVMIGTDKTWPSEELFNKLKPAH